MEKQSIPWYRQSEMLVALSAILTSVVALAISVYSAYIDRSYARASVWPSLMVAQQLNSEGLKYVVLNQGTGPAIIHYARVSIDNDYLPTWSALLAKLELEGISFTQAHISAGVIRSGQQINAFGTTNTAVIDALTTANITAEICYCSVYEDCWVSYSGIRVEPTEVCEMPAVETRFLQ